MSGCERCREALGGYVLGALEPAEAREVEEHLASCQACRSEHRALAGLPELLELADPAMRPTEQPPARLEERVLDRYASSPRRHGPRRSHPPRRRLRLAGIASAGALAGVAATVALLVLLLPERRESPTAPTTEVRLTAPGRERTASGRATLTNLAEVTSVRLQARELRPTRGTEVYEMWFLDGDEQVSAGTFRVSRDGAVDTRLSAATPPERDVKIAITREPDRSDPAPSETVVLAGRV